MNSPLLLDHPTPDSLHRRGALALFSALAVALAVGLLAWGPLLWSVPRPDAPHTPAIAGWQDALVLLASVALVLAGVSGWRALGMAAGTGPSPARTWRWFFAVVALQGLACGLHHALGALNTRLLFEFCCAVGGGFLFVGLMADRVHARWASPPARVGVLALSALAAAWWLCSLELQGSGDMRGLLFIDTLPLLALAAGVAGLPTCSAHGGADISILAAAYGIARLLSLADGSLLPDLGLAVSQGVALFAIAGSGVWFAQRLSSRAPSVPQAIDDAGSASKTRSTSLNTSG